MVPRPGESLRELREGGVATPRGLGEHTATKKGRGEGEGRVHACGEAARAAPRCIEGEGARARSDPSRLRFEIPAIVYRNLYASRVYCGNRTRVSKRSLVRATRTKMAKVTEKEDGARWGGDETYRLPPGQPGSAGSRSSCSSSSSRTRSRSPSTDQPSTPRSPDYVTTDWEVRAYPLPNGAARLSASVHTHHDGPRLPSLPSPRPACRWRPHPGVPPGSLALTRPSIYTCPNGETRRVAVGGWRATTLRKVVDEVGFGLKYRGGVTWDGWTSESWTEDVWKRRGAPFLSLSACCFPLKPVLAREWSEL